MEHRQRRGNGDGNALMNFRQKNLGFMVGVAGLLLVIAISWFALQRIEVRTERDIESQLQSTLNIMHNAVEFWVVDSMVHARRLASRPHVVSLASDLVSRHSSGEDVKESSALLRLRSIIEPVLEDTNKLGFFIISPDRINVASMRDSNLGEVNLLNGVGDYLDRIFAGSEVLVLPVRSDVPLPGISGELVASEPTMFVGVPVFDESGRVIAALTMRIDPSINFTRIIQMARTGETGDTYAFNRSGYLISESRFDATLRELGLIGVNERGILNLRLLDPGGNLTEGYLPGVTREELSFTRMVEMALAGRNGVDTKGYRDYRGVPVVGAWYWDAEYGFGLAAEVDLVEAYASYYQIRRTVLYVLSFAAITFFGLGLSARFRNRRLVSEMLERRKAEDEVRKLFRAVEQSPSTVVITDLDGKIEYVNPKFAELTGYTFDEVTGKSMNVLKSGGTNGDEYKKLWETITSGGEWRGEFQNKKKNGELYWESASISPVKNSFGKITHYIAVKEDITERRKNEAELAEYRGNLEALVEKRSLELQKEAEERQRAEGSLARSEAHVRVLLDSTVEAIYGMDLYGNCTFANPACAELTGYDTPEELIGLNMHKAVHHSYADGSPYPEEECGIYRAVKAGEGTHSDTELFWNRKGKSFPVEFWSYPVRKDGEVTGFVVTFFDITERKRAEGELKKAYSLNLATLESTTDGILVVDMEGGFSEYNKRFLKMWRIPDSLMDQGDDSKAIDFVMSQLKDSEEFVRKIKELYATPEADSFDLLGFVDGRVWERYSHPQRLGTEIVGRVWSFRDITERVNLEHALVESEGMLKEAQQIALMGHWELNVSTGELYWSDETYRIFGLVPQQFSATYEAFLNNVHPEDRDFVNKAYRESVSNRVPYDITHRLLMADGTVKVVNEKCRTEYAADGTALRSIGTIQDITERVQAEEESIRAQKLESVGLLAGGIAHDFNNLLTSIIGNLSLAQIMITDNDKVSGILRKSETASRRAAELTRQLLTFAKGGEPVKNIFSIATVVRETVDFALKGSGIKEEVVLQDGLWPVEADEGQISQVLNNLVINARQAMDENGSIRVECTNLELDTANSTNLPPDKYIKVEVRDTGVGMSPEILKKIFDPYFTTKESGTGLGLATSYKIIERHGGRITAESAPDVGTTVTLYLPALSSLAFDEAEEREEIKCGKGRVLVMDDDAGILDLISVMLKHSGYAPVLVEDGQGAVDMFEKAKEAGEPFVAVVVDLVVKGGMGGKEATEKILSIEPDAVVIVSSGYLNDPVMIDYKKYGFKGILPKPYTASELSSSLYSVLEAGDGQDEAGQ